MDARFVYMPAAGKSYSYLPSRFKATYGDTLKLMDLELDKLDARDVTIQAGFPVSQIRLDGWPYSKARPEHPEVILQFRDYSKKLLTLKGVKFATFEENLRAIALSLHALRAVDRYGVVEGRQYDGFKQLGEGAEEAAWTWASAMKYMQALAPGVNGDADALYKSAVHVAHPDKGGTHEQFVKLRQAYEFVKAHDAQE